MELILSIVFDFRLAYNKKEHNVRYQIYCTANINDCQELNGLICRADWRIYHDKEA